MQKDLEKTRCSDAEPASPTAPSVDGPEGTAFIERIGWEDRKETPEHPGGPAFTATLVFTNGGPDISAGVVWKKTPVRLVIVAPQPERVSPGSAPNTDAPRQNEIEDNWFQRNHDSDKAWAERNGGQRERE